MIYLQFCNASSFPFLQCGIVEKWKGNRPFNLEVSDQEDRRGMSIDATNALASVRLWILQKCYTEACTSSTNQTPCYMFATWTMSITINDAKRAYRLGAFYPIPEAR